MRSGIGAYPIAIAMGMDHTKVQEMVEEQARFDKFFRALSYKLDISFEEVKSKFYKALSKRPESATQFKMKFIDLEEDMIRKLLDI